MDKVQVDYLKKYYIFNTILVLWIAFIPLKNAIYQGSVVLMILLFIFHSIKFQNYKVVKEIVQKNKIIFMALLLIFVSMVISSLLGVNTKDSLSESFKFLIRYVLIFLVLLYFYYHNFFTRQFLITIVMISLGIYAFDGLYQYINGVDIFKGLPLHGAGIVGPLHNRNVFGFIMAIGAIISSTILVYNIYENKIVKFLIAGLFFLMLFNLFFSMSRASWLFFTIYIVSLVFYGVYSKRISPKVLYLFLAGIAIAILLFFTNESLISRFNSLLEGNSSGRFDIWKSVLPYIYDKFLFGYGIDTFTTIVTDKYAGVHNLTLEILLFLGLFGLFVYTYFFYVIFVHIYKIGLYEVAFFLVGYLTLLQFDGSLVYSKINLSVLVIVLFFAYSKQIKNI